MNVFYITTISYFLSVGEPDASIDIVIYIILVISVLLNAVLLISRINKKNDLPVKNTDVDFEQWYNIEKRAKDKLKDENWRLNKQLNSLQNNELLNEIVTKDTSIENKTEPIVSSPTIEQKYEDEKPHIVEFEMTKLENIYLPSPFENNRFSIEDISSEQTSSSLYQIILDSTNTSGKLLILENADFTRALNSPDLFLEKACLYENAFNPTANGIIVVEPGKVKLDNQDWLITEKIKIKFI